MSQHLKDWIIQFVAHTPHIYYYFLAVFIVANLVAFFVAVFFLKKHPIVAHRVLRFILGLVLIEYGVLKFFKLQGFSMKVIGDINSVPSWKLFWYFFGHSYPYLIFLGCLECTAGLLLLSKQTWRLGALLALSLLGNIAVMDYVYEVGPVKYWATTLTALVCLLIYADRPKFIRALEVLTLTNQSESTPN